MLVLSTGNVAVPIYGWSVMSIGCRFRLPEKYHSLIGQRTARHKQDIARFFCQQCLTSPQRLFLDTSLLGLVVQDENLQIQKTMAP